MANSLRKIVWQVIEAENSVQASTFLEQQKHVLILLDLMMPEMNGFELIDSIRCDPSLNMIPVIVIPAMELDAEDRKRLEGKMQQVLLKRGYNREELLDYKRNILFMHDQRSSLH